MRLIAPLPLSWIRGLGTVMGWVLYALAVPRRRVIMTNLALCFPQESLAVRRRWARECVVHFAQAWFDRAWLWNGKLEVLRPRLRIIGAVEELQGDTPTVIFAPHFFGLDAAGTAINDQIRRPMVSIYTPQRNEAVDQWLHDGRRRFGNLQLFYRDQGVKGIVAALREGALLYLLSDMNFGPEESIFVPFYGVQAATVPSLPRFARLGRAKVVPVTARLTPQGYDIEVHPAWENYPSVDVQADTAYMNHWLEGVINTMPSQYYWVHKRFKTRPPGEPSVY
ncbi:MAG: lipid A biosynthesis acyltransferase [Burkholderiales bacterium]|nr:lipid A biosynthesis acyltransferase [Burkholderiales bacterium]